MREKRRRDVHLLELSSSAEVVSNFRGKIIARISSETVRLLRVNHSVKHERVQREERTGAHYVVDSIADCPAVIDEINARLARGDRP